jgi:hypothetical protein
MVEPPNTGIMIESDPAKQLLLFTENRAPTITCPNAEIEEP